jgi:ankyrin repeat protein
VLTNIQDRHGCIALHWAVVGSVIMAHSGGFSPWKRSITTQEEAVVRLVENTSDVNMRNNDGQTALHWAVRYGERTIAQRLIEQHADLEISDVHRRTALDWARERATVELKCHYRLNRYPYYYATFAPAFGTSRR